MLSRLVCRRNRGANGSKKAASSGSASGEALGTLLIFMLHSTTETNKVVLAALIPTNYPEMACEAHYSLIFIRYQPTIVAVSYPECGCSIAAFSRPLPRCYPLSYRPSLLYCFVPMGPVAHS